MRRLCFTTCLSGSIGGDEIDIPCLEITAGIHEKGGALTKPSVLFLGGIRPHELVSALTSYNRAPAEILSWLFFSPPGCLAALFCRPLGNTAGKQLLASPFICRRCGAASGPYLMRTEAGSLIGRRPVGSMLFAVGGVVIKARRLVAWSVPAAAPTISPSPHIAQADAIPSFSSYQRLSSRRRRRSFRLMLKHEAACRNC